MPSKAQRAEATRRRLLRAARELFAKRGYSEVGTEEIVRRARVTRGALYHHFRDKRDLFRAVHEEVEAEISQEVGKALADAPDLAEQGNVAEILRTTLRWLGQDGARAGNRVGSRG